ncbi:MAG: molybdenum cofactor guanylyltransferase [Planctomycetota bacterium]
MTGAHDLRRPALDARDECHGIVLCGGQSRRMGRDKARLAVGSHTLLEHAVATLRPLARSIVLACGSADRYADLGLPRVLDTLQDGGPLAGLDAGLAAAEAAGGERAIALACDMPLVTTEVLRALADVARARDLDVCFLETEGGLEPLCGVWRVHTRAAVRAALDAGERKVLSFARFALPSGRKPRVGATTLGAFAGAGTNVNTPADLDRAQALVGAAR